MYYIYTSIIYKRWKKIVSIVFYPFWNMLLPFSFLNALWEHIWGIFENAKLRAPSFSICPYQSSHKKHSQTFPSLCSSSSHSLSGFFFHILCCLCSNIHKRFNSSLLPPNLILCKCREYIPCYQPQFTHVLKIKTKSIPLSLEIASSACAYPSPAVLSISVH